MNTHKLELDLVGTKEQPCYIVHGTIYASYLGENEYPFSLQILGESKESADQYLEYMQSDQFPHIAWMIKQMDISVQGKDAETSQLMDGASLPMTGIISVKIRPMEQSSEEIPGDPIDIRGKETRVDRIKKDPGDQIEVIVEQGAIQVSTSDGSDLLMNKFSRQKKLKRFLQDTHVKVLVEGMDPGGSRYLYNVG